MASSNVLDIIVRMRDEASQKMKNLLGTVRGGINQINSAVFSLQGAIATLGLGLMARSFLKAGEEAEILRMRLNLLVGSVERGNDLFKQAAEYAAFATAEYEEIMQAVTSLAGVVGGSNENIMEWTKLVTDVSAATNLSVQETTMQIVRMYAAGAQSAELFKERGVLAMLGFQVGVSYSAKETRERLMEVWKDPEKALHGASMRMARTFKGLMSMMADYWMMFKQTVMDAGLLDYLKAIVQTILNQLDKLKSEGDLSNWAKNMADQFIILFEIVAKGAAVVGDAFRGWQFIWYGLKGLFGVVVGDIIRLMDKIVEYVSKLMQQLAKELKIVQDLARQIPKVGPEIADSLQGIVDSTDRWLRNSNMLRLELAEIENWANNILESSNDQLINLAGQVSYYEKIETLLIQLRALQRQFGREQPELPGKPVGGEEEVKTAKPSNVASNELAKFRADQEAELAQLELNYEKNLVSFEDYFKQRREMVVQYFAKEIALTKELLSSKEVADDPDKQLDLNTKLYTLEKEQKKALLELDLERHGAVLDIAEAEREAGLILEDVATRISQLGDTGLTGQLARQWDDLYAQHEAENKALEDLQQQHIDVTEEKAALHRAHELEKEKLHAEQKKKVNEFFRAQLYDMFGNLASAMYGFYEASGGKAKEFFAFYKAMAIAQTIISTYESAQHAYDAMAKIPYAGPGLAKAAAAAAIAAGLARVAVISSQQPPSMYAGGKVPGYSPNDKADNIPAMLTAGEYVHPVDSVRYYGTNVMEALRKKKVPKEVFEEYLLAEGGKVVPLSSIPRGAAYNVPIRPTEIDEEEEKRKRAYSYPPQVFFDGGYVRESFQRFAEGGIASVRESIRTVTTQSFSTLSAHREGREEEKRRRATLSPVPGFSLGGFVAKKYALGGLAIIDRSVGDTLNNVEGFRTYMKNFESQEINNITKNSTFNNTEGQQFSVNVPLQVNGYDAIAERLKGEIEDVVIKVLRREFR